MSKFHKIRSYHITKEFPDPSEVCYSDTGDVAIASPSGIMIYNSDGRSTRRTLKNEVEGRGVTVDPQGPILVTENSRGKRQCSSCDGSYAIIGLVRYLNQDLEDMNKRLVLNTTCQRGHTQISNGYVLSNAEFQRVNAVAVRSTPNLHKVVRDIGNNCLYIFKKGKCLRKITISGSNNDGFENYGSGASQSSVLGFTSQSELVIGDPYERFLRLFTLDGHMKKRFDIGVYPLAICVDSKDEIIVADANNHRVILVDLQGRQKSVLIANTIEAGVDIRPHFVYSSTRAVASGFLAVLLRGLPGTKTNKVSVYSNESKAAAASAPTTTCTGARHQEARQAHPAEYTEIPQ